MRNNYSHYIKRCSRLKTKKKRKEYKLSGKKRILYREPKRLQKERKYSQAEREGNATAKEMFPSYKKKKKERKTGGDSC